MTKILRFILMTAAIAMLAAVNTGCTAKLKKAWHESRADKFYAAGQYDRAEIEYLNVVRNDRADAKAFARLGSIYFDQGRYQTAAPFLIRASTLATNDLDIHLKLGMVYATAGRMADARLEANFILDRNPQMEGAALLLVQTVRTTPEAAPVKTRIETLAKAGDRAAYEVALGTLAYRENDSKTAEADFRKALTLDPKSTDAYEALGALLATKNDVVNARVNFKAASDLSPVRSTKRMMYARFELQSGDTAAASQILGDVLAKAPDYVPALMGQAEIALAGKKFDECRVNVTKILARDPNNFDGLLLDARLRFTQGDVTGTMATLEQMTRLYPQAPRVHFQLGAGYLATGDDNKAVVSLNRALELDPNYTEAILMLAQIQIKNQNPDPAIVALGKLVQKYPQLVRAQLLLADGYRQRGQLAQALGIYAALESTTPKTAQIWLVDGSALLQAGDRVQARQRFEHALVLTPDNLPALEQLVNMDVDDKNYAAARQRIQAKLDTSPTNMTLHLLVSKVQLAAGDHAGAEKTLLEQETADRHNAEPYLLLAQLYFDEKQNDKAMEQLQAAISREPENLPAMMLLATADENAKDYKGAAAIYEKMLVLNPKCSPALNNLAYLDAEFLGQPDRAYELAQQARDLLPFDPAAADTLGWVCLRRGSYPTALSLLRESAAKLTDQPEVQYHFGLANYMVMNEAAAQMSFQRALAGGKDFRGREDCLLCLDLLNINPQTADAAAVEKLEKRISAHPEDPVAQSRLGVIYDRSGKADKAIAAYEAVLKTDTKNLLAMKSLARLYENKDAAKAYDLAKATYKLAPNDGETAHVYGRLAYQNGDFKLAGTVLQSAVQNQPGDASVQFDFARASYSLGRLAVAQSALQTALAGNLPPAQADEARRMADFMALANNPPPSAAAQVESTLKSEPDYVPALMVQARLKESAGDLPAATAACEKILARFQDFGPAQRELAILYSKDSSKTKIAYGLAMKAREAYPNDPPLAKATAIIVFQQGDFTRSASLLKDCAATLGTDPEIFYYLGAAQFNLKDNKNSKANLKQALALKLSGPQAESAQQMLGKLK